MMAMLLQFAVVTAKPLFDRLGQDLVGEDGVTAIGAGLQHRARIEVHHAKCIEPEPRLEVRWPV